MIWKLSQDGLSASRTLDNGSMEARLVSAIDADELATALPADPIPAPSYQELRQAEYPPMSDYMDAIIKGDVIQQQAYIDKCIAVKLKYPKV